MGLGSYGGGFGKGESPADGKSKSKGGYSGRGGNDSPSERSGIGRGSSGSSKGGGGVSGKSGGGKESQGGRGRGGYAAGGNRDSVGSRSNESKGGRGRDGFGASSARSGASRTGGDTGRFGGGTTGTIGGGFFSGRGNLSGDIMGSPIGRAYSKIGGASPRGARPDFDTALSRPMSMYDRLKQRETIMELRQRKFDSQPFSEVEEGWDKFMPKEMQVSDRLVSAPTAPTTSPARPDNLSYTGPKGLGGVGGLYVGGMPTQAPQSLPDTMNAQPVHTAREVREKMRAPSARQTEINSIKSMWDYADIANYKAPKSLEQQTAQAALQAGIRSTAHALGVDPIDLATAISYETGSMFSPTTVGPTTKWGTHKGMIQFGEPQAEAFGIDWSAPAETQLGPKGAIAGYLKAAGVKPGTDFRDIYSAINAGSVGKYNASDEAVGGMPGTVQDKVSSPQMAAHREVATRFMSGLPRTDQPTQFASTPTTGPVPAFADRFRDKYLARSPEEDYFGEKPTRTYGDPTNVAAGPVSGSVLGSGTAPAFAGAPTAPSFRQTEIASMNALEAMRPSTPAPTRVASAEEDYFGEVPSTDYPTLDEAIQPPRTSAPASSSPSAAEAPQTETEAPYQRSTAGSVLAGAIDIGLGMTGLPGMGIGLFNAGAQLMGKSTIGESIVDRMAQGLDVNTGSTESKGDMTRRREEERIAAGKAVRPDEVEKPIITSEGPAFIDKYLRPTPKERFLTDRGNYGTREFPTVYG